MKSDDETLSADSTTTEDEEEEVYSGKDDDEASFRDEKALTKMKKFASRDSLATKRRSDSIKEGWLWKKHRRNKLWTGWHRRYFVLEGNCLEYYRNPRNQKRPLDTIQLTKEFRTEFSRRKAGKHDFYEFIVHAGSGMYMLAALTEKAVQGWVEVLDQQQASCPDHPVERPHLRTRSVLSIDMLADDLISSKEQEQGPVVKEGFLYRRHPKGKILRSWHKRYFVLFASGRLAWYRIDYKNARVPRGNLLIGGDCTVCFPGTLKKTKRSTFSPFTVLAGSTKLEVGGPTFEESSAWVDVLKTAIGCASEAEPTEVEAAEVEGVLLERKQVEPIDEKGPEEVEGEVQGWLYKKCYYRRKLMSGWHRRFFVLKGNELRYFRDSRMRRLNGAMRLGSDCLVDFPCTTTVRAGREVYPFSIFTENHQNNQVLMKTALLLGCPNRQSAEDWVDALQVAIHTSTPEAPDQRSIIKDGDEEEDSDEGELSDQFPDGNHTKSGLFLPIEVGDGSTMWIRPGKGKSGPVFVDEQSEPGPAGTLQCVAVMQADNKKARLIGRNVEVGVWLRVGSLGSDMKPVVVVSDGRTPTGVAYACFPPSLPATAKPGMIFPAVWLTAPDEHYVGVQVEATWRFDGAAADADLKLLMLSQQQLWSKLHKAPLLIALLAAVACLCVALGWHRVACLLDILAVVTSVLMYIEWRRVAVGQTSSSQNWSLKLQSKVGSASPAALSSQELAAPAAQLAGEGEGGGDPTYLLPPEALVAGSSGFRHLDPDTEDTSSSELHYWSTTAHDQFKLRIGPEYKLNRLKAPSQRPLYQVFCCDVFQSPNLVCHFANKFRYDRTIMERLDAMQRAQEGRAPHDILPPLLIMSVNAPMFPPSNPVWGAKRTDGPTCSMLLFCILDPWVLEEPNNPAAKLMTNFVYSEKDDPIQDRVKMCTSLGNAEECNLNRVEKVLESKFNSIPWLTRPDHNLYRGRIEQQEEGGAGPAGQEKLSCQFQEIFVNCHTFAYLCRSTGWSVLERVSRMVIDVGVVLEAHTDEELPEQLLCCCAMHKMKLKGAKAWPGM